MILAGLDPLPPPLAWLAAPLGIITAGATFVVGTRTIYRKLIAPMISQVKSIYVTINSLEELKPVLAELRPNGGSSLRDAIDRIESMMNTHLQKQDAALDYQEIAWFEADQYGNMTRVSRAWCLITGLSSEDANGNGWMRAVHRDDKAMVMEQWTAAVRSNMFFESEFRIIRDHFHAKAVKVYARANPLRYKGKISTIYGFMRLVDDDNWRTALQKLETSLEEKQSIIINSLKKELAGQS